MKFLNSTDYPTSHLRTLIIASRRFCADEKKLKALKLPWRTWRTSGTITGIEVRYASKTRSPHAELFGWESTATFGSTFKMRIWVPRDSSDANLQFAAAVVRAHLVTSLNEAGSDAAMRHRAAVLRICKWAKKYPLQLKSEIKELDPILRLQQRILKLAARAKKESAQLDAYRKQLKEKKRAKTGRTRKQRHKS